MHQIFAACPYEGGTLQWHQHMNTLLYIRKFIRNIAQTSPQHFDPHGLGQRLPDKLGIKKC